MRSEAQKRADRRYNEKLKQEGRYTVLTCKLKGEQAEAFKAMLKEDGMTVNGFLVKKIAEYMKREGAD